MKRIYKILLFVGILTVGVLGLGAYWTLYRPLPEYEATIELPQLREKVEIKWGPYGVPHIYANNKHDLYMAVGYVHAQDRLWQMTLAQLAAQGRFAEFFGQKLLPLDKFQRTIGFWRTAQKMEAQLPDSSRRVLQAYAAGVNQYVASHGKELPIQFALAGMQPIHWTPTHSLALARLMGWELNIAWKMELVYTLLSHKLSPVQFNELFPKHKIAPAYTPPLEADSAALASAILPLLEHYQNYQQLMGIQGTHTGSNAWAVDSSRTSTGKPLLAGDPHLGLSIPGKWYEVHLNLNGRNLSGATLPGAPAVVLGQNDVLAWSLTSVMLDGTDFFKEIVNPQDSSEYLLDSLAGDAIYTDFTVQHEIIKVKNADDIIFTRKLTKHGPVISNVFPEQELTGNRVISMQWIGLQAGNEFQSLQAMGWASSFKEFKEAIKGFKVPGQHVIYADTAGNIGLFTLANVPIRYGNPLLIRPGWKSRFDWKGYVPYAELPRIVNPEKGWVANANNAVANPNYPYYISAYWPSTSRYQRIEQYLSTNNQLTPAAFQVMQNDTYSEYARIMTRLILPALKKSADNSFSVAIDYLKNWDYAYETSETAASILDVFLIHLSRNVFQDEMGKPAYRYFTRFSATPSRILMRMLRNSSAFFDNIQTPKREYKGVIIRQTMQEALSFLRENYGPKAYAWRWGNLHTLTLKPPFFGKAAQAPGASSLLQLVVDNLLSKGPFPVPGHAMSINKGEYLWSQPFDMVLGPSIRRIVDLSNTRRSLSIIPGGQSGNPFSEFYGDQTTSWLNGQYKFLYQDSSLFNNYKSMILTPKKKAS